MIDTRVEREIITALHDTECEAVPCERLRRVRQYVSAYLYGVHASEILRNEIEIFRIVDHAANKDAVLELEPIMVGVVPTDMRIDRCRHCRNIADARNVPRHDR